GKTTCGLLIGSSIAIGLRHGKGLSCVPLEEKSQREKAIAEVNDLYRDFIDNFKYSDCQTLIQCDFSKPGEPERFREDKLYEGTCVRFFNHLMTRFVEADKKAET
ncbi:MAG: C_GCAxxG_C_C family protein, partial [Deltaproteobacteria bacterium]|nr:C_GCAxxG_C_C family protein [Deltaproteobacteria bacterium]